jgi:hypothetical protein
MSDKTDHVGVTTMETLDQGHLHLLLDHRRLTCPGYTQASAVEASTPKIAIQENLPVDDKYFRLKQFVAKNGIPKLIRH